MLQMVEGRSFTWLSGVLWLAAKVAENPAA
jgi:hypothetical protein